MNEKERLRQLIFEAQELLDRLVKRFEDFNEKEVKAKTRELRTVAEKLNRQLINIASLNKRFCTNEEVRLADDIVFQLSIYDDICEGYLNGI